MNDLFQVFQNPNGLMSLGQRNFKDHLTSLEVIIPKKITQKFYIFQIFRGTSCVVHYSVSFKIKLIFKISQIFLSAHYCE
jgi:hypothetical protein